MSTVTRQKAKLSLVPTAPADVDRRLRRAFPEIDFDVIATKSLVFNHHNVSEKWDSTVRQFQWWLDVSQSLKS